MRAQPGPQQGPDALHGVDMDLVMTVTVLVAGMFPPAMADGLVLVTPFRQARVYVVLIGVDERARCDQGVVMGSMVRRWTLGSIRITT